MISKGPLYTGGVVPFSRYFIFVGALGCLHTVVIIAEIALASRGRKFMRWVLIPLSVLTMWATALGSIFVSCSGNASLERDFNGDRRGSGRPPSATSQLPGLNGILI